MMAGKIILEPVIQDAPADVVSGDAGFLGQLFPAEPRLFHTELARCPGQGQTFNLQQLFQHIVVVEDRQLADFFHAVRTQAADKSIYPHQYRGHAVELAQLADTVRPVVIQIILLAVKLHRRYSDERSQFLGNALGACRRSLAAMGRGKRFVQVVVTHIKTCFLGPGNTKDTVQVGLVVRAQASRLVHDLHKLLDAVVIDTRIFRVGDHEGCRMFGHGRL